MTALPTIACPRPVALTKASAAARDYAQASKAPSTRRAYQTDAADFAFWCKQQGAEPLPASIDTVAAYLASLAGSGLRASTITRRCAGIRYMHRLAGLESPTSNEILYRGADGRTETNKRQPPCPLPRKLIAHLARARRGTVRFAVEYDGDRVQKLRRSWRTACKAAGLGDDVTPHTLRHTAVTWRLLKGVKMWDVAHYVGMSEKMVRENYGHRATDHLSEARDAI